MYQSGVKHGRAQYGSWAEIPTSIVGNITGWEGDDSLPLSDQKFAQLVYSVNQDAVVSSLTQIAGDYSSLIRVSGDFTFVMKAPPGTPSGSTGWQIKRIHALSGGNTDIEWANGSSAYSNIASDYGTYSYTT